MQMEQWKSSAQDTKKKNSVFFFNEKKKKEISEITLCTNISIIRVPEREE